MLLASKWAAETHAAGEPSSRMFPSHPLPAPTSTIRTFGFQACRQNRCDSASLCGLRPGALPRAARRQDPDIEKQLSRHPQCHRAKMEFVLGVGHGDQPLLTNSAASPRRRSSAAHRVACLPSLLVASGARRATLSGVPDSLATLQAHPQRRREYLTHLHPNAAVGTVLSHRAHSSQMRLSFSMIELPCSRSQIGLHRLSRSRDRSGRPAIIVRPTVPGILVTPAL